MLGIRLDGETERLLDSVARAQGRSKSEVGRDAIRRYVELNDVAYRAEAKRQSLNAVARGWTEEDAYWESIATTHEEKRPLREAAE